MSFCDMKIDENGYPFVFIIDYELVFIILHIYLIVPHFYAVDVVIVFIE